MAVFEIYAGDTLIHHSQSPAPEVKLLNPKLKLEISAAGSFTCKVPPTNNGYDKIDRLTTEIRILKDGEELWSGRVISEEMDFWQNRSLTCEGELAYLNDTTQPPYEYHNMTVRGFLEALITVHNNKVSSNKKFSVGVITVTDPNDSLYRYTNFESTLEAVKDKMIDRLGGYIRIRKENGTRYLDYLSDPINTNSQTIEFGKNLLDFSKSWDLSDFATVVLPQGAMLEESSIEALDAYLDVSSVNNGSIYVYDQTTVNTYGWIEVKVSWSDVTQASNLLSKAKAYLSDIQFDNMVLEISAVDMTYMFGADVEMIKLFDNLHCVSNPHGMDRYFPLTKIEIPIDNPEDTTFTLGDTTVRTSLSASIKEGNRQIMNYIDSMPSNTSTMNKILDEAKENANQLMNQVTNGYITIDVVETSSGIHSESLYISDNVDLNVSEKSGRYWKWNVNGLSYYKNGTDLGLALTMDGAIVADKITTGILNADLIKAGTISDVAGYNYWNLKTGEMQIASSNSSTGAKIQLANGIIKTYGARNYKSSYTEYTEINGGSINFSKKSSSSDTGLYSSYMLSVDLSGISYSASGDKYEPDAFLYFASDGKRLSLSVSKNGGSLIVDGDNNLDPTIEISRGGINIVDGTWNNGIVIGNGSVSLNTQYHKSSDDSYYTYGYVYCSSGSNYYERYAVIGANMGTGAAKMTFNYDYHNGNITSKTTLESPYLFVNNGDGKGDEVGFTGWFSNGYGGIIDEQGVRHDLRFKNGILVQNDIGDALL